MKQHTLKTPQIVALSLLLAGMARAQNPMITAQSTASIPYATAYIEVYNPRARAVTFGCDAPPGNNCYANIYSIAKGFLQKIVLQGGARAKVTGVVPGVDRYILSVNATPPDQLNCNLMADKTRFCKIAVVNADYNN